MMRESGLELGRFSSFCPKAIATIKHLPETLADRCIVIAMQRMSVRDKCERLRNLDGQELRRKCGRFVADHAAEIAKAEPALPEDLSDRAADIWEPLLVLADLAGGDWPQKAREAAVGLTAVAQEESPIGTLLLDLMVLFITRRNVPGQEWMKEGKARAFSRDAVAWLNSEAERPWMALRRGKAVTELWLSDQLRLYGVRPKTIWIGQQSAKGYVEEDFVEIFRRYIPRAVMRAFVEEQRRLQVEKPPEPPPPPVVKPEPPLAHTGLLSLREQLEALKQQKRELKEARRQLREMDGPRGRGDGQSA